MNTFHLTLAMGGSLVLPNEKVENLMQLVTHTWIGINPTNCNVPYKS
jgi:hypothetical protein